MLPKKNRLQKQEINKLKESKEKILQGKYFGLIFQTQPEDFKFGLIASANISKKAVDRNRIKRSLFRALGQELMQTPGKYLFLAKKNTLNAKQVDFDEEIKMFNRLLGKR